MIPPNPKGSAMMGPLLLTSLAGRMVDFIETQAKPAP